jgi:hypothetical protein
VPGPPFTTFHHELLSKRAAPQGAHGDYYVPCVVLIGAPGLSGEL